MNEKLITRNSQFANLIFLSAITGLMLFSLIPIVSETFTSDSAEFWKYATTNIKAFALENPENITTLKLTYNLDGMNKRNTANINDLSEQAQMIKICFWPIIIFGLIAYIGVALYATEKRPLLSNRIMLIAGGLSLILSILIVFLHWRFIGILGEMENIELTPFLFLDPLRYMHLTALTGVISSLSAVSYISYLYLLKEKESKTKIKKDSKRVVDEKTIKIETQKTLLKDEKIILEDTPPKPETTAKNIDVESMKKIGMISSPEPEDKRQEEASKEEKSSELVQKEPGKPRRETSVPEDKKTSEPFPSEKMDEKTKGPSEVRVSKSFEQALQSAIERKQTEIKKQEPEKLKEQNITVRCPQCNNIFKTKKEEGLTEIECPKCGKKGVAKF